MTRRNYIKFFKKEKFKRFQVLAYSIFSATYFLISAYAFGNVSIFDGKDAAEGQFPWFAAIGNNTQPISKRWPFCGGALVAPQWVVTAHHCLVGEKADELSVMLNSAHLNTIPPLAQEISVDRIYWYDETKKNTNADFGKDLALLHLSVPARGIIPIPLANVTPKIGANLTIMGYGYTNSATKSRSSILQYALVKLKKNYTCGIFFTSQELCSESIAGYGSRGDSGGPLIEFKGVSYYLTGIISRVSPFKSKDDIYTSISFPANYQWLSQAILSP